MGEKVKWKLPTLKNPVLLEKPCVRKRQKYGWKMRFDKKKDSQKWHQKTIFKSLPIVCFKTIKVTKQGYRQDRQQRENRVLSSHIWWQNGGCFSA